MDERRVRTANRIVRIGSLVILAVVLGYMLYEVLVVKPEQIGLAYKILIGVGVFGIWFLSDIFAVWYTKEFSTKTPEQISAYKKYAALGLVGYGGLVYFASAIESQNGFYGALVYVFALMMNRKLKETYDGIVDEDEEEDVIDEASEADETPALPIDVDEDDPVQTTVEELPQQEAANENQAAVQTAGRRSVLERYQSAIRLVDSVEETDAIEYEVAPEEIEQQEENK